MSISEHPLARPAPLLLLPDPAPPPWTALLYRLPGADGRTRTALWRTLRDLDALKLGQGTWALPHRTPAGPDLRRAFDQIHGAGGEVWARTVDGSVAEDQRLQERLATACEHLWDAFFNELDRVEDLAHHDDDRVDDRLTALRGSYGATLARDLLGGAAARRAGRRLGHLEEVVRGTEVGPAPRPEGRHRVDTASVVLVERDEARVVVQVTPAVPAAWERAFNDFESFAYRPSDERTPLRHNAFTFRSTPSRVPADRTALAARVARFEAYLDG